MNRESINLRPRLKACADFVKKGSKAADIGTDHGYLAAYLILKGISPFVTAADIGEGPLKNAEETVKALGIEDETELVLSDGLKNLTPGCAENIIIAGMGGTLIADILYACSWIKKDGVRLILQPMSHSEDVREYLYKNGFSIVGERAVCDTGRDYCVICADYRGEITENFSGLKYVGRLPEEGGEIGRRIISRTKRLLETRLEAIRKADRYPEEQREIEESLKYFYDNNL